MNADLAAFDEFRESLKRPVEAPADDELTDAERVKRAATAFVERLDRQTAVDFETCIHCGMCAEACHFYMATGNERYAPVYKFAPLRDFYRRELGPLRWLYKPFVGKLNIDDLRDWQELVYEACTGCGRCDMMCPMGINISTGINIMREGLARAGLVPAELRALQTEQRDRHSVFGVGADELKAAVGKLAGDGVDVPLDKAAADVMVLTTAVDIRLFPEAIAACAKIMQKSGADWTVSAAAFEAANIGLISGDASVRRDAMRTIVEQAKACGAKFVVVPESGHAYQALRWEAADELGAALPFEVLSIPEYVAGQLDQGTLRLQKDANGGPVAYHDPCRLSRHGGVYDEPRRLLGEMGFEVRETDSNRRENLCCGGGCGEYTISHSAPLRQKAFELKRHELDHTEADAVVIGCSNCRINLMIGAANSGWNMPVVSLAETVAGHLAE